MFNSFNKIFKSKFKVLEQIAQGDILFVRVDKLPSKFKGKDIKNFIFAYGEKTGHKHQVMVAEPKQKVKIEQDKEGKWFMKIDKGAVITHEQHSPNGTKLNEGNWIVMRQKEFDQKEQRRERFVMD
jgi:hypothetical protein